MSRKEEIGMIGVGLMGHGIAKNILAHGYSLQIVGHRNRKPVEELVGRGAREVRSPADLARRCDMVFICVTGSEQVEEVVTGKDGILEGCREGLIVVDCSTSRPDSTLALAERLKAKGGVLVDAPLARTPKEAEEGRLNVMAGAEEGIFARVRPVIETFAENIFHIGPVGTAHTIKLINNFLAISAASASAEAAVMARAYGVDLRKLFELVSAGGANSGMFQMCMPWLLEGDESRAQFAINNALKDMTYLSRMVADRKEGFRLLEAVHGILSRARDQGLGDNFVPRLADSVAQAQGVKLRP